MKSHIGIAALAVLLAALPVTRAHSADIRVIDKDTAFTLVLENHPQLAASLARIESAKGERLQASLPPNPSAGAEIENFAGSNDLRAFDSTEITLSVEQEIETADKRGKRTTVAQYDIAIARQQAFADISSLLAETDAAFMRLAVAQARLKLAEKRVSLAAKTHEAVKRRVSAAASSDIQHTKADIEQTAAGLEKAKAEAEAAEARVALASLLGISGAIKAEAALDALPELPEPEELETSIRNTPPLRAAALAKLQASSRLDLEKARAVPNPALGFGIKRLNENDSFGFVAGVSVPLPVFNKNQGAISAARAGIAEADANARRQELDLRNAALTAREKLSAAHREAKAYQTDMAPAAERAYAQAAEGYDAGRFTFLELLDAQRTLYQVQEARLDSLAELYQAKAQIDYLMNAYQPRLERILGADEGDNR